MVKKLNKRSAKNIKSKALKKQAKRYWFWAELSLFFVPIEDLSRKNAKGIYERRVILMHCKNAKEAFNYCKKLLAMHRTSKKKPLLSINDKPAVCRPLGINRFDACVDDPNDSIGSNAHSIVFSSHEVNYTYSRAKKVIPSQSRLLKDVDFFIKNYGPGMQLP